MSRKIEGGKGHEQQPKRRRLPWCFKKVFGRFAVDNDPSPVAKPDILVHVTDGTVSIGVTDLSSPASERLTALDEIYRLIQEQKADARTKQVEVFPGVSREAEVSLSH